MMKSDHGYTPEKDSFLEQLNNIQELKDEKMPLWDLVSLEPLLDSSSVSVDEWNKIGEIIANAYESYDGFVVLHGTDTMAYTASACCLLDSFQENI